MDRRFTRDRLPHIDLISAIDKVLDVFRAGLRGCVIQVLEHRSSELVFADF